MDESKLADLVVVVGDPLPGVRNARDMRIVIKNGEAFSLEALLRHAATRSQQ